MAGRDEPIVIADCRGGRNNADPPHSIGLTQVTSAANIEWYRATVARKRRGSRLVERESGLSGLPTNQVFTTLVGVQRPTNGLTPNPVGVMVETGVFGWVSWGYDTGYDWVTANTADTGTTSACVVYFNGLWFAAYKSAVDRLHYLGTGVAFSTSTGYRVGYPEPSAAPTITESAGAITDNRKYRHAFLSLSGSTVLQRGEPGPETGVRTLVAEQASAAAPGAAPAQESYNAWELQVASDDDSYATWWVVGQATTATAIVDNNASILALEPAPELGLHEPPHSAKYLGVDDNRLLMAGAYESATDAVLQSRVWFTPVKGDLDIGDDQRIPDTASGQKNWVDVDAGDQGGEITGFGPATLGDILVFKRNQVWRLVRTGNIDAPYLPRPINKSVGTFGYRTIQAGEDAQGQPCVYFAGQRGPYRVGVNGVEYLGAAIEDLWTTVYQFGNVHTSQHAVYYPNKGQYWLWLSINGATVPSLLLIYSVRTGGWAEYSGPLATARCASLLPRFIQEPNKGVTIPLGGAHPSESAEWVPYACPNTNGQIAECDAINPQTGVALDTDLETYSGSGSVWTDGTTYAGSLITRPLTKPLDGRVSVTETSLFANAASGVTLAVSLIPDYDTARTRTATVLLTASGSEVHVFRRVDGAKYANAKAIQMAIGDPSSIASQWVVNAIQARVKTEADR